MLFSIKSSSSSTSYVNDGVSPSGSGGLKASSDRASLQQLQSYHEVQLSPLDLTALSLLPGDDAIVFACDGTPSAQLSSSDNDNDVTVLKPICIGKAWPSSTLAASSTEKSAKKGKNIKTTPTNKERNITNSNNSTVRVPLVSEILEALLPSHSVSPVLAMVCAFKYVNDFVVVDQMPSFSNSFTIRNAHKIHIIRRRSFESISLSESHPSSPISATSPTAKSFEKLQIVKEIPLQVSDHRRWSISKLLEILQGSVLPLNSTTLLQLEGGTISLELSPVIDDNESHQVSHSDLDPTEEEEDTKKCSSTLGHSFNSTLYVIVTSETRFIEGPVQRSVLAKNTLSRSDTLPSPSPLRIVGGLEKTLSELEDLVSSALLHPERFTSKGLKPPRGALLEGPPGTGKTLLAKALSMRMNVPLMIINGGEAFSGIVGETERRLRQSFVDAANRSPVILFIDELDGLCPKRDWAGEVEARIVATMLALMDGIGIGNVKTDRHNALAEQALVKEKMRAELVSLDSVLSAIDENRQQGVIVNSDKPLIGANNTYEHGTYEGSTRVFILGATNRASAVDSALRRPGRFDREFHIGVPSQPQRVEILNVCLSRFPHALSSLQIEEVASKLHGYVGADLAGLCREAALCAWRRQKKELFLKNVKEESVVKAEDHLPMSIVDQFSNLSISSSIKETSGEEKEVQDVVKKSIDVSNPMTHDKYVKNVQPSHLVLTETDLYQASRILQPSALREVHVEVPKVAWTDIGGQIEVKNRLREAVEWPLTHPEAFVRMGIQPPKGVLLYGPPGCSKTMMARAMATEGGMNFIAVKGPELFSKYVGDSEKAVANIFAKARAASPCVIFFDEFDALARQRGSDGDEGGGGGGGGSSVGTRVVSQLLQELDGVTQLKQVVVVAATNRPDLIDKALLRPGRIDRSLLVGLPDRDAICRIVEIQLGRVPYEKSLEAKKLVDLFLGYSGAEIVGIFREAAIQRIKKGGNELKEEDLKDVVEGNDEEGEKNEEEKEGKEGIIKIKKGVTREMMKWYEGWRV
jgi:SpoVK/Ycf46/Vps4 family AAA+-type ATPase